MTKWPDTIQKKRFMLDEIVFYCFVLQKLPHIVDKPKTFPFFQNVLYHDYPKSKCLIFKIHTSIRLNKLVTFASL